MTPTIVDAIILAAGLLCIVAGFVLAARWKLRADDDDEQWRIDNGHG